MWIGINGHSIQFNSITIIFFGNSNLILCVCVCIHVNSYNILSISYLVLIYVSSIAFVCVFFCSNKLPSKKSIALDSPIIYALECEAIVLRSIHRSGWGCIMFRQQHVLTRWILWGVLFGAWFDDICGRSRSSDEYIWYTFLISWWRPLFEH